MSKDSTKSKNIYRMPGKLWKLLKKHLPKAPKIEARSTTGSESECSGWHLARTVDRLPMEID